MRTPTAFIVIDEGCPYGSPNPIARPDAGGDSFSAFAANAIGRAWVSFALLDMSPPGRYPAPMVENAMMLNETMTMEQVEAACPGARRALFRKYHIGGCSSCGFAPTETLAQLCARNGGLNVDEVIAHVQAATEADRQLEVAPKEVAERRTRGEKIRLLDLRTREEWDAVRLEGAEFVTQELVQRLMGSEGRDGLLVFYDHAGASSLDAAAYFAGHGFNNARFLRGGIDAWSQEVDPAVPRYRLENDKP